MTLPAWIIDQLPVPEIKREELRIEIPLEEPPVMPTAELDIVIHLD